MKLKRLLILFALSAASVASYAVTPGPGTFYATDAYPGFDNDANILPQERKTPSMFWWRKAKFKNAKEQLLLARVNATAKSYDDAVIAYEALVAEFPYSAEAVIAQEELADLYLNEKDDPIAALEEYKYIINFYSSNCDYDSVVSKMYETACKMREKGKRILFKRFDNTTDVRRAFETVVMSAPGASFAPEALYAIVELRIKDEEYNEAIEVCRMLRNRYSDSSQAKRALDKEAESRMTLFRRHSYNRDRGLNTVSFLDMAIRQTDDGDMRDKFMKWRNEAYSIVEKEAYEAAKFYDSRTRKRRGAVNAYERFLKEYPASPFAPAVRERIAELKSMNDIKEFK